MPDPVGKNCIEINGVNSCDCYSSREENLCSSQRDCVSVYVCATSLQNFIKQYSFAVSDFIAKGCNKFSIKIPQIAIKIPQFKAGIKIPATVDANEKTSYTPPNVDIKAKDCESGAGGIRCY